MMSTIASCCCWRSKMRHAEGCKTQGGVLHEEVTGNVPVSITSHEYSPGVHFTLQYICLTLHMLCIAFARYLTNHNLSFSSLI